MFEYNEDFGGYVFFVPTDFDDVDAANNVTQLSKVCA